MKKTEIELRCAIMSLNGRLHLADRLCEIHELKKQLKIKIKELQEYENQSKSN